MLLLTCKVVKEQRPLITFNKGLVALINKEEGGVKPVAHDAWFPTASADVKVNNDGSTLQWKGRRVSIDTAEAGQLRELAAMLKKELKDEFSKVNRETRRIERDLELNTVGLDVAKAKKGCEVALLTLRVEKETLEDTVHRTHEALDQINKRL